MFDSYNYKWMILSKFMFTKYWKEGIINKKMKRIRQVLQMIKKILTLKIVFNNILSIQKYKKETKIPKENICVLGISKL